MNMADIANSIYESSISLGIRELGWLIPTVQSIHIVSLALLFGSALAMELRLMSVFAGDVPVGDVVRRHLPWLWGALVALLATGLIMVIGEPDRTLNNSLFWYKMALVFGAFVLTLSVRRPMLREGFELDTVKWAAVVKPSALVLLLCWVAVIFCGRWIAYVV